MATQNNPRAAPGRAEAAFARAPYLMTALAVAALTLGCWGQQTAAAAAAAAPPAHRTVVLIVTDGLRWQEVFRGAAPELLNRKYGGLEDVQAIRKQFGGATDKARRRELLPFFWRVVARRGEVFGDRDRGAVARVTNRYWFSYPGYNEMLTGHADPRINSNSYGPNPNQTVFGWLNREPGLRGRVAVFATWDAFTDIFNEPRSHLFLRTGWQPPDLGLSPAERQLNWLYAHTTRLWRGLAYDSFMQAEVLDYLRHHHPRVLFVGYGETDEWAHAGRYGQVLLSAHRFDYFVSQLWRTMQANPFYRGRTDFVLTTDHGRGGGLGDWKNHGASHPGSGNIWIGLLGPGIPAAGVLGHSSRATQSQIAATIAALLGRDWRRSAPQAAPPLPLSETK
ncbi:MAG: alkaline phosphatase family protein [Terriglobia bacterium]